MKQSRQIAPHVQSFIEADVTQLNHWREKAKRNILASHNEKLTFTPLFIMAVIHALKKYPVMNGLYIQDTVIKKKEINIGVATALPDGNIIVPVIKKADCLNILGLCQSVNAIVKRAREAKLNPEEIQGGTYTITNIGNFNSLMGTPIINQPQLGILAIGAIRKVPAVVETSKGDFIGIRQKVILSHSYNHAVINGATGGMFVKAVADYLEQWHQALP